MQSLALVFHVVLAVAVIGLVLIQHGKGADAGAAFGSGASATVFGARGSASFLTRATTALATLFFLTSIFLFYLAANREGSVRSVTDVPGLVDEAPAVSTDLPGGVVDDSSESDVPPAPAAGDATSAPAVEGAAECSGAADLPAPAQ
jgi:preprotein translocase subunit SecG